jgi:hypothetical protein
MLQQPPPVQARETLPFWQHCVESLHSSGEEATMQQVAALDDTVGPQLSPLAHIPASWHDVPSVVLDTHEPPAQTPEQHSRSSAHAEPSCSQTQTPPLQCSDRQSEGCEQGGVWLLITVRHSPPRQI